MKIYFWTYILFLMFLVSSMSSIGKVPVLHPNNSKVKVSPQQTQINVDQELEVVEGDSSQYGQVDIARIEGKLLVTSAIELGVDVGNVCIVYILNKWKDICSNGELSNGELSAEEIIARGMAAQESRLLEQKIQDTKDRIALRDKIQCIVEKKGASTSKRDISKINMDTLAHEMIPMFEKYNIKGKEQDMFLAHVMHETGNIRTLAEEDKSKQGFAAGRGLIQLTGCSNYMAYAYHLAHPTAPKKLHFPISKNGGKILGNGDCSNLEISYGTQQYLRDKRVVNVRDKNGQLMKKSSIECGKELSSYECKAYKPLEEGESFFKYYETIGHPTGKILDKAVDKNDWYYAVDSAGWFWRNSSHSAKLTKDANMEDTIGAVNGGTNGTSDRIDSYNLLRKYKKAKEENPAVTCDEIF